MADQSFIFGLASLGVFLVASISTMMHTFTTQGKRETREAIIFSYLELRKSIHEGRREHKELLKEMQEINREMHATNLKIQKTTEEIINSSRENSILNRMIIERIESQKKSDDKGEAA